MNNIINEKEITRTPGPVSLKGTETIIKQMKYCVCRIYNEGSKGTGFFAKIPYKTKNKEELKELPVLITNRHVIDENDIKNNKSITLSLNNGKIENELILDNKKRIIYTNKEFDITIVEIKEYKDDLKNNYLELDDETINIFENGFELNKLKNKYSSESLYLINYPKDKDKNVVVSYGSSPKLVDYKIRHYCTTEKGSSGSPILLIKNQKLIGIHRGCNEQNDFNLGTLLLYAIKDFQNTKIDALKDEKKLNNNEINNYIIGDFNIRENKEIRIINSYEQFRREYNTELKKECENEKEIKEKCEIMINDKKIKFSYFHKFDEKGNYTIKYIFKKNIKKIDYMFYECTSLTNIDLTNFCSDEVINVSGIFCKCSSLIDVKLSNFNTRKIFDMSGMFSKCTSLEKVDLSNFDTCNTTNMNGMFCKCSSLREINLSNFDTSKVTNMSCMFYECKSLTEINLSNFKTNRDTDMNWIFTGCSQLSKILMT